jgi:protein-L-isoaspartate(D-aspartate) O-methyltransferase
VFIEGAVASVPAAIAAQLRQEAGRLVTVIRGSAGGAVGPGQAMRGETTQAGLQLRPEFDCATPSIPALLPAPAFTF